MNRVRTNDLLKIHSTAVDFFKLLWLMVYIQTKIFLKACGQVHLTIMTGLTHVHVSRLPCASYTSEGDYIIMGCIQLAFICIPEGNVVAIHGSSIHSAWFYKRKQINNILLLLENTKLFCYTSPKLYSSCNVKLLALTETSHISFPFTIQAGFVRMSLHSVEILTDICNPFIVVVLESKAPLDVTVFKDWRFPTT